jgi:hypothetical protein
MIAAGALRELPDLVPPEVSLAYARFLGERTSEDAYLFTEARVRFEARSDDVIVALPGLAAEDAGAGTTLRAPSLPGPLEVALPQARVARFLTALDGERTLDEATALALLEPDEVETLLRSAFGRCLFSPLAVAELERGVSAAEIVRFPGSPYEIPRSYWSNLGSVRRLASRLFERVKDPLGALDELRRLHVVTLVGESGASFYRPASPIAKKGIEPGRLWLSATRILETPEGTGLVEGPRVNATFVGGARYGALVAELAGDALAAEPRREYEDEARLGWGRVVFGRAPGDDQDAPWFCPPRPLSVFHVESTFGSLAGALDAARAEDRPRVASELAAFHQKLIRLHLFRAANQSLAMSVVNAVLGAAGERTRERVGIPHLVLDQLALRLSVDAYRKVFALALAEWTVLGSPGERLRRFADKKRRAYALIERVQATADLEAARALAEASPEDARLALLVSGPGG